MKSTFYFLAVFAVTSCLVGQSSPVQEALQQQAQFEAQQRQERESQQRAISNPEAPRGQGLDGETLEEGDPNDFRLPFHEIEITGCALLEPQVIGAIKAEYEGTEMGMTEVNNILRILTNAYIAKGLITCRAFLPDQDLTSGVLKVECLEGDLSEIIEPDGRQTINAGFAFPGLTGNVLNIRDIEQGLDQINRLHSNDASMQIAPGTDTGETTLVIENQPTKRWKIVNSFNNSGFETSGKYQASTFVQVDNLLGINDQLNFNYGQDVTGYGDGNFSRVGGLSLSVPYGYWLFQAGANYYEYENEFKVLNQPIINDGNNWNYTAGVSYTFFRDQARISTLHVDFAHTSTDNFLNNQKLIASSRKLSVIGVRVTHIQPWKGGQLYVDGGYSRGLTLFDAFDDSKDRLNQNQPQGQFNRWNLDISYTKPLAFEKLPAFKPLWRSQISAQYSPDRLFSSQQFSIGGQSSVRGFQEENVIRNGGFVWRNELSHAIDLFPKATPMERIELADEEPLSSVGSNPLRDLFSSTSVFAAVDVGHLIGPYGDDAQEDWMVGAAFGFRFGTERLSGEVSLGIPLASADSIQNEGPVFLFSLSSTF